MIDVSDFKNMWTTEINDYYLRMSNDGGCTICKNNMVLIIEDDDMYIEVIRVMIKNNVKVIKYDSSSGADIFVPSDVALKMFDSIPRKDVKVKIIWNNNTKIIKQLIKLKKVYNMFSQIPIVQLYNLIDINEKEWIFAKMNYYIAKELLEKAQDEGIELKIEY